MNYAEGLHFSAFHFLGTGQVSPVCPLCTSTGRNGGYKHTAQLNTNVSIRATEAVDPRLAKVATRYEPHSVRSGHPTHRDRAEIGFFTPKAQAGACRGYHADRWHYTLQSWETSSSTSLIIISTPSHPNFHQH